MSARSGKCVLAVLVLLCGGCATYTEKIGGVYEAVDAGHYSAGIERLNKILAVESSEQTPEKWTATRSLAVLERAILLQAKRQYKWSARDLSAAEAELELLDLNPDAIGKIGKYIYSDSAQAYKTPPTERLAISALNMVNYLAMNDLDGATVEARRFTVSRNYLESLDKKTAHGAFGSYLAGFIFDKRGEPDQALRYYEEALDAGDLQILREPILRLSKVADYRGPKLREYLKELQAPAEVTDANSPGAETDGEILILLGVGRVPYKIPKRIPVGAAIAMAGPAVTDNTELLATLALKMIVYPELVYRDNVTTGAAVSMDGQKLPVEMLTNLSNEVTGEYDLMKPKIIAAALTRMIARAAAAEAARRLPRKADDSTRSLAALAAEAALLSLDRPDTRSWTLLPAHVCICRARVPPGRHELQVQLQGKTQETRSIQVDVPPGGFAVAAVIEPR
jgi:hypothetical protein